MVSTKLQETLILSKRLSLFCKGFSAQHFELALFGKWQNVRDKNESWEFLLADLFEQLIISYVDKVFCEGLT